MTTSPSARPHLPNGWMLVRRLGLWTFLVFVLTGITAIFAREELRTVALNRARDSFHKDVVYRQWATQRGGVYVPLDEKTPANPYLAHIPDREIQGSNGKTYTLVNPAYMTRMVHELGGKEYGLRGHLTSLKPLRPENAPDAWEQEALEAFETGRSEVWDEVYEAKGRSLRYMGAFRVQEGCLRCHAQQGYKVGDIRGGISVTVPMGGGTFVAPGQDAGWISSILSLLWVVGGGVTVWIWKRQRQFDAARHSDLTRLLESEQRFRAVLEGLPVPVYLQQGMRLAYANPAGAALFDVSAPEQLLERDVLDFVHPDFRAEVVDRVRTVLESGQRVPRVEQTLLRQDGTSFSAEVEGIPVSLGGQAAILLFVQDLTERQREDGERRRMEDELQHAQRLESLGHLAGGVAHDMNNVLAAILGLGTTLRAKSGADAGQAKAMDIIVHAAERGRELVKGLTDFARKGLKEHRAVDLNEVVRSEAALLNRTTLQKVEVVLDLAEPLPPVLGDPHALGNALMNLCVNALDAMPEGGALTVSTRVLDVGLVELEVTDTGEGMAPAVAARALEPFYTTKPVGQGTGLGLSAVYGTVKAHGGQMRIESQPGEGARVSIQLPCMSSVPPEAPGPPSSEASVHLLRILLVDDDELVRGTVPQMLELLGHTVETAPGGAEALARLERGPDFDGVILDLNMPGMNGTETLRRLRHLHPDLPVLIASGFKDADVDRILTRFVHVDVLMKPYTLGEIREALARLSRGS